MEYMAADVTIYKSLNRVTVNRILDKKYIIMKTILLKRIKKFSPTKQNVTLPEKSN